MIKLNLVLKTGTSKDTDILTDKEKDKQTSNHRDSITSWPQSAGNNDPSVLSKTVPTRPIHIINNLK